MAVLGLLAELQSYDSGFGGLITAGVFCVFFLSLQHSVLFVTGLVSKELLKSIEARGKQDQWRNFIVSYFHAFISTVWCAVAYATATEQVTSDLIFGDSPACRLLLCFSTGYFAADSVDMLLSKTFTWQLQVHHTVVLLAYLAAIHQGLCGPYLVAGLSVEFSNIFLHSRKLMLLAGVHKETRRYHVNLLALMVSFVWRFWVNGYLLYRVIIDRTHFPAVWMFAMALSGMLGLNFLNFGLLSQILTSDAKQLRDIPKVLASISKCPPLSVTHAPGSVNCGGVMGTKKEGYGAIPSGQVGTTKRDGEGNVCRDGCR
eukprot:comp20879_c2_seq1/m.27715 comp20879_c2_seq1/g.27715  ORF comp20879_c2_seq1/g.27715 comp20879_c2_seq1/m.27715 type:complete len:315 (-) comp20879_c2_seq1:145-1089(-)